MTTTRPFSTLPEAIPLTLAVYLHRIDPFVIQFTETIGLRWYGLSYVAGFLMAYWAIRLLVKGGRAKIPHEKIADFILAVAIGTLAGGRLGYCLFYQPGLLIELTAEAPFWGVLAINKGGMASHGGMIGIALAALWFARKHKLPPLHLMDLLTLGGSLGIFFGRIANFINGELLGRPCDPGLPWAVRFPHEIAEWGDPNHPGYRWLNSPEYQGVIDLVRRTNPGAAADGARDVIAAAQTNDAVALALEPLLTPLHPSQLYAALLEGLLIFALVMLVWRRPRKPGVIAGVFLTAYPVVRIFDEIFRTPDSHIGFDALGLTRGQWISVLMLLIGAAFLVISSRRPTEKIGGWGKADEEPHG
ncbi:MAG: prolipoprotein diacylglyceryl transferase [Planctomycetota bacterium]